MTPTARTLIELRKRGYTAGVVEKWIPQTNRRVDFAGCIDVIGMGALGTIAVQATSASNVSARVRKITETCQAALADMRAANWTVVVWGWKKTAAGKWAFVERDLS